MVLFSLVAERSPSLSLAAGVTLSYAIPECRWPFCRMPQTLSGYCVPHSCQAADLTYEGTWEEEL